jgi:hypothetical protein
MPRELRGLLWFGHHDDVLPERRWAGNGVIYRTEKGAGLLLWLLRVPGLLWLYLLQGLQIYMLRQH